MRLSDTLVLEMVMSKEILTLFPRLGNIWKMKRRTIPALRRTNRKGNELLPTRTRTRVNQCRKTRGRWPPS